MARFFMAGTNLLGGMAILRGRDAEHVRVLRLRPGEDMIICDGEGTDYKCRLVRSDKDEAECEVIEVGPCPAEPCVKLTVLYGSVRADDIVLKDELDAIEKACPDVKVVHVLSDEPDWPGEKGFNTRELIEKYSEGDVSYMFCGPLPMYTFVKKALDEMGVTGRRFRHDVVNNPADVSTLPGYPRGTEQKTFTITVRRGIHEDVIEAKASEPVAVALERAGIAIDTHCRNGECGFCRSHLLAGEIVV